MFSWGEDSRDNFGLTSTVESNVCGTTDDTIHVLKLGFHIKDLSAGHSVFTFIKSNGNSFIIRTNESQDGRRVKGRQKFVKCKEKIQAVSCGDDIVTLLSEEGRVFCVDTTSTPYTPRPLDVLCNISVTQVACGSQHSVALTKDGQVYTWGRDSIGQLGLGKRKHGAASSQHLRALSAIPVVHIAAGGDQSFALSVSGNVFGWGRNNCGQLGMGDTTDRPTPTPVHSLNMKETIYISCGKDHTAILTKGGAVYTFGSGQYGQLGHNSFRDELCPQLVAELWGAKVIKIACGRHHTLVLTDSKKVYSFGCGEHGQLGHGKGSHQPVPLPVPLSQDSSDGYEIRNIYAGGNCSFATCTSNEEVHDSMNSVTHNSLEVMIDKWVSECASKFGKKTRKEIHRMFSSASCMNKSFLDRSHDKHFQTSAKYSGLDLSIARLAFKKLVKSDQVWAEFEAALLHLLPSLDKNPVGVEGLRIYLLLSELLHVIEKHKRQHSTNLTEAVADALLRLSDDSLQILENWISSLRLSTMVKHVAVWKRVLSLALSCVPVSNTKQILQVLQCLYNANDRIVGPRRIPESNFCLRIKKEILEQDLCDWRLWIKNKDGNEPPMICSFPFLMDLQSKKMAFDIYATYMKFEHQQKTAVFPWPFELFQPDPFFFELKLKRAKLLDGTFEQLAVADYDALKKPLMVYFDENSKLTDVNKRDFFYHLFKEMMSAKSGMFIFNDSKTLAWFPSKEDNTLQYFLFGILCGLALYNQSTIHLPFPLALFKKLVNVEPSLADMKEFNPDLGKNLQYILEDCTDDDIESLYMNFSIDWDGTVVELDPENPGKPLTSQNKKEFVDAYVNHVFSASVLGAFAEFRRGFFMVCDVDLVLMFRPAELQGVMVGKDVYDWTKLKQNTNYRWIYHQQHPTIQMFWEVFDELSEDLKKAFLLFLTGFERVPILGMDQVQMTVQVLQIEADTSYNKYLPEVLTCHSLLQLPLYSSKEIMRSRLTEALNGKRGFSD
ncbi:hypothetical protein LDENG_00067360 [Lucifuga dentata]|nr:hypothetical protein LDENG_00067360 [Lucifuga dentata]